MTIRRRMRDLARAARIAAAGMASVLAVSSYLAYTTAGFDFEAPTGSGVVATYYRLRWDDGSTWVGRAVQPVPTPRRRLDWFDPGGTILARPTHPARRTWANALGFWRVDGPADDPYVGARYPGATSSRWVAVPSWLVLLALWGRPLARWPGRGRHHRVATGT